jgi:hypothetical protein
MDTIRDMVSVGLDERDHWTVWYWGGGDARKVGTFPREDEAWGVTTLILEYVERHLYDPQAAIWAALDEYHQAYAECAFRALDNAPTPDDLAYQDHAHAMGYVG